jgi:5'(3')-deoxyribonucleotidase
MKNIITERFRMQVLAGIIKEGEENEQIQVWFDLDGVLADMQGSLNSNDELKRLRGNLDNLIDAKFQEYKGLSDDQIKAKFKAELEVDPNNQDLKQLKKVFREYNNYVFVIAGKHGFYANLSLMPGAHEMVKKAYEITGVKPNILSSPAGDENDPTNPSVIEKKEWVNKNFGDMIDHIEITTDKARVARGKKDILIDDREKYVNVFKSAGGSAILFKDYISAISDLENLYIDLTK